jgi:hypothetical protein
VAIERFQQAEHRLDAVALPVEEGHARFYLGGLIAPE